MTDNTLTADNLFHFLNNRGWLVPISDVHARESIFPPSEWAGQLKNIYQTCKRRFELSLEPLQGYSVKITPTGFQTDAVNIHLWSPKELPVKRFSNLMLGKVNDRLKIDDIKTYERLCHLAWEENKGSLGRLIAFVSQNLSDPHVDVNEETLRSIKRTPSNAPMKDIQEDIESLNFSGWWAQTYDGVTRLAYHHRILNDLEIHLYYHEGQWVIEYEAHQLVVPLTETARAHIGDYEALLVPPETTPNVEPVVETQQPPIEDDPTTAEIAALLKQSEEESQEEPEPMTPPELRLNYNDLSRGMLLYPEQSPYAARLVEFLNATTDAFFQRQKLMETPTHRHRSAKKLRKVLRRYLATFIAEVTHEMFLETLGGSFKQQEELPKDLSHLQEIHQVFRENIGIDQITTQLAKFFNVCLLESQWFSLHTEECGVNITAQSIAFFRHGEDAPESVRLPLVHPKVNREDNNGKGRLFQLVAVMNSDTVNRRDIGMHHLVDPFVPFIDALVKTIVEVTHESITTDAEISSPKSQLNQEINRVFVDFNSPLRRAISVSDYSNGMSEQAFLNHTFVEYTRTPPWQTLVQLLTVKQMFDSGWDLVTPTYYIRIIPHYEENHAPILAFFNVIDNQEILALDTHYLVLTTTLTRKELSLRQTAATLGTVHGDVLNQLKDNLAKPTSSASNKESTMSAKETFQVPSPWVKDEMPDAPLMSEITGSEPPLEHSTSEHPFPSTTASLTGCLIPLIEKHIRHGFVDRHDDGHFIIAPNRLLDRIIEKILDEYADDFIGLISYDPDVLFIDRGDGDWEVSCLVGENHVMIPYTAHKETSTHGK